MKKSKNSFNESSTTQELELAEQNEQLKKDLSDSAATRMTRIKIFYGDPSAEKAVGKIDAFAFKLLDALEDEKHPLHKTLGRATIEKLVLRYFDHVEFRAKLDWAKEQYYEVGSGGNNAAAPNTAMNVFVGGNYAETSVPIYD